MFSPKGLKEMNTLKLMKYRVWHPQFCVLWPLEQQEQFKSADKIVSEMPNMQHYSSYCCLTQANPEAAHHESSLWGLLFPLSVSVMSVCCCFSSQFWFLLFPVALPAEPVIGRMAWFTVILIDLIGKNTAEVSSPLCPWILSLQLSFYTKCDIIIILEGVIYSCFLSTCGPYSTASRCRMCADTSILWRSLC